MRDVAANNHRRVHRNDVCRASPPKEAFRVSTCVDSTVITTREVFTLSRSSFNHSNSLVSRRYMH
ncbi:hypothetical protein CJJ17_02945 [Gordonia polyisoprenivorans]|nr:hypothetical protein CJJ17_02945 [Gordonia polyisoprenivorans]